MPTYYDEKTKTWFCQFRYTDSNGNKKQKRKRGFKTKKEAKEFERDFLATQQQSLEMKFSQFLVLYNEDMSTRLKPKTILVKEYIIKKHILPYFENKKMNKIGAIDIRLPVGRPAAGGSRQLQVDQRLPWSRLRRSAATGRGAAFQGAAPGQSGAGAHLGG